MPHFQTRTSALLVQDVDGETLVYDTRCDRVHCLPELAARIWRACDGTRDASALAEQLTTPEDIALRQVLVEEILGHLTQAKLLEGPGSVALDPARRRVLRHAGAAVLASAAVLSIVAPLPAQAGTCISTAACSLATHGHCCTNGLQCFDVGGEAECAGRFCTCIGGG